MAEYIYGAEVYFNGKIETCSLEIKKETKGQVITATRAGPLGYRSVHRKKIDPIHRSMPDALLALQAHNKKDIGKQESELERLYEADRAIKELLGG